MELLLIAVAGVLSLLAGAVAAFALQEFAGVGFRTGWAGTSLLFFVIPGVAVMGRDRRARRANRIGTAESSLKENNG